MRASLLLATAATLALGACTTVGPNFKAPDAPAGPAGDGYAMAGDPASAAPRLDPQARVAGPWWTALSSPELDRTIREALASSPSAAEAAATLERYQAEARSAGAAAGVQAGVDTRAERQRFNSASFGFTGFPNKTFNLFQVGANVSYDLDLFGGQRRRIEVAGARVERAARQADAAYLTLSGNVAIEAVRIAALRAQIDALTQVIADDRALVALVDRARDLGAEAPTAGEGARAQLADDEALLPPLQRQLDASRHQLALLVGKSPAAWTAPEFTLAGLGAPSAIPVTLPSALVRKRPDILASEAELHAAIANVGVATAAQYPDLKLTASFTQSAGKPEDLWGYDASGWNLLGDLAAPIFDGGRRKADRAAAEAEARAAMARYQQTVLRAFVQVSDRLSALGADEAQIEALGRSIQAAESRLADAQTGQKLGGLALRQVIESRRLLNRYRRTLAEAEGRRLEDIVGLYAATAADWR